MAGASPATTILRDIASLVLTSILLPGTRGMAGASPATTILRDVASLVLTSILLPGTS